MADKEIKTYTKTEQAYIDAGKDINKHQLCKEFLELSKTFDEQTRIMVYDLMIRSHLVGQLFQISKSSGVQNGN